MSRSKITSKEITELAKEYIESTPSERIDILKKIWAAEQGCMVVAMVAGKINVASSDLINWIKDYYYNKRMWRYRGRKMIVTDPPAPGVFDEIVEIAEQSAGWNSEQRFTRRNTLTGATRNRASTISGAEYFGQGYGIKYGSGDKTSTKDNGNISRKARRKVFQRDNYTCQYCGFVANEDELEIDDSAGSNLGALITCCKKCFSKQGIG